MLFVAKDACEQCEKIANLDESSVEFYVTRQQMSTAHFRGVVGPSKSNGPDKRGYSTKLMCR